jgi:hypothetical protein
MDRPQVMHEINRRVAVVVTKAVRSMWMAYAFTLLALAGLPAALRPGGEGLIAWVAQTFLQLVLLSVIMVGQDVQSQPIEQRDRETHDAVMEMLDDVCQEQHELIQILNQLPTGSPHTERRGGPRA